MFAALGVDATRLYSSAKTKKFSDCLPKIGVQLQLATCFRPGETDLLKLLNAGCTNISAGDGLGNVIFEDVVTFRIFIFLIQRRMLDRKFHHRKNNGVHQANERENTGKWATDQAIIVP